MRALSAADVLSSVVCPVVVCVINQSINQSISNCWSQPDATEFMVRGLRYMSDKLKVPSEPAAYSLLGVDLLLSEHKVLTQPLPPPHACHLPA